jgi:orotate phosphoribosyltransferase
MTRTPAAAGPDRAPTEADLAALGQDIVAASYLEGDFLLSSGARSRYYLDKYLFETQPDLLRRIAGALASCLPPGTDRLAGTELGAVALATAVSLETGLPFVIVRKETKGYSTGKAIEGRLADGESVVVVEDVVTSGAQAIRAADRVREAGARVAAILAVVDREEGGREAVQRAGYELITLFERRSLGI